jgi:hypothetical protein
MDQFSFYFFKTKSSLNVKLQVNLLVRRVLKSSIRTGCHKQELAGGPGPSHGPITINTEPTPNIYLGD